MALATSFDFSLFGPPWLPPGSQGNPHTIEEVRRILRLHAGLNTGMVPPEPR